MVLAQPEVFVCQCPERGDLHFYMDRIMNMARHGLMCQCPERGDLHFYAIKVIADIQERICVNALKGATFISTYSKEEII